jgi:hypothetical protein
LSSGNCLLTVSHRSVNVKNIMMVEREENQSIPEAKKEKVTTIDDLLVVAGKLYKGLIELSQRENPLEIRRGVMGMNTERESEIVKAQGRNYFFDVEKTKEGKPYLRITESHINKENNESVRNTILVFQEDMHSFIQTLTKMAYKVVKS